VDDVDEMVDTVALLAAFGDKLRGNRVSVVTQSGGMGSLTADFCDKAGLKMPALSPTVQAQLHTLPHLLNFDALGNPADVRGASVIGTATTDTLLPFLHDPDTDVVVLLLAKSTIRAGEDGTAQAIVQATRQSDKPLLVVWVGQREVGNSASTLQSPATKLLINAGIPTYPSSRRAIAALSRAVEYTQFRRHWLADPEVKL
ncbi:MAG: hypothetical protein KAG66_00620, partial [Methylococcales bacterium]|nr:hypothetical protein [Methylococcales bacterium]